MQHSSAGVSPAVAGASRPRMQPTPITKDRQSPELRPGGNMSKEKML